jgi:hypothetical protein
LKEEDISRSENETTKNVVSVSTLLWRYFLSSKSGYLQLEKVMQDDAEAINIFKLVINPNDFAQSVENIFYLSFLIRDGKVAFETNEEGEPVVCASFSIWLSDTHNL